MNVATESETQNGTSNGERTRKRVDLKPLTGANGLASSPEHRKPVIALLWAIGAYGKSYFDLRLEPGSRGTGSKTVEVTNVFENRSKRAFIFAIPTSAKTRQLYIVEPPETITPRECADRIGKLEKSDWRKLGEKKRDEAEEEWRRRSKGGGITVLPTDPDKKPSPAPKPTSVSPPVETKSLEDLSKKEPLVVSMGGHPPEVKVTSPPRIEGGVLESPEEKSSRPSGGVEWKGGQRPVNTRSSDREGEEVPWRGLGKRPERSIIVVRAVYALVGEGVLWLEGSNRELLDPHLPEDMRGADYRSYARGLLAISEMAKSPPLKRLERADQKKKVIGYALTTSGLISMRSNEESSLPSKPSLPRNKEKAAEEEGFEALMVKARKAIAVEKELGPLRERYGELNKELAILEKRISELEKGIPQESFEALTQVRQIHRSLGNFLSDENAEPRPTKKRRAEKTKRRKYTRRR